MTERTALDGYVQDGKRYPVSLEYAGQTVKIVTESVTVPNTPQKGMITVHKTDSETGKPVTEAEAVFDIHAKPVSTVGSKKQHPRQPLLCRGCYAVCRHHGGAFLF